MTTSAKVVLAALLLLLVPLTALPSAADPAPGSGRRLVTLELPSPLVDTHAFGGTLPDADRGLRVNVLLPAGYDDNPDADYPVLYLLHGASGEYDDFLDPNWVDISGVLGGVPAVIVMPDGGTLGMYSDWWRNGARSGPNWVDYHLETLRTTIEETFRIRDGRRWHAIAGISMGGQGALRYAAMMPGYFGSVAGLSAAVPNIRSLDTQLALPVLLTANGAEQLVTAADIWGPPTGAYAKAHNPTDLVANLADTRVYLISGSGLPCPGDALTQTLLLDIGTEADIRLQQIAFARSLRTAGVDVTERRPACGVHTFGVWRRAFADIVATWDFFGPVPDAPDSWTYRTGMPHGRMWQFDYKFTALPGFDTFARSGNTLTATGSGTVTLSAPGCSFTAVLPFTRSLPSGCP